MSKPGVLLLLLAVAASQLDLSVSMAGAGETDISACPITFYGREFTKIHVSHNNSVIAICFKNSSADAENECLLFENHEVDSMTVEIKSNTTAANSSIHQALPAITSASRCWVEVALRHATNDTNLNMMVSIYNFGAQTAVQLAASSHSNETHVHVKAVIDETLMSSWSFVMTEAQSKAFFDVSGCRHSDGPLAANTMIFTPETCSTISCDASAVLSTVSTGCPQETVVCAVTGSTVIDFFSRVHSVTNRCVYTLMDLPGGDGFSLLAGFLERRRRDVMFLDHLILWLRGPGVKISLEQGGRVLVDDQMLTLNSTVQLVHGLELSKDRTGVTVHIPYMNMRIIFDGNTAHVAGHASPVGGLCGNPSNYSETTTLSAAKSSSYSTPGCETEYNDIVDPTINCNETTKRCSLMRQKPFSACHNHTDPEPYITACTDTLCTYPDVDGLSCQFMEAYAKSCKLQSNVELKDWKYTADCPAVPEASCQDQYCSRHEFCGEKMYGDTRCFCRAIFASKYQSTGALGEPTVCSQNSATLTLAGCLLEDKGIDYKVLHLNDESCQGHMDDQTHMVTFGFDSSDTCGMEVMMNDSQLIYKNTVTTRNSSLYSVITRYDQVEIDFSCFYRKPEVKTVAFRIKDSSVIQQIVSGAWNYTLIMNAYTDPGLTQLVSSGTEVVLNQKIWMELKTEGLDDKTVSMVIDSCWATNQPSPNGNVRYDLIRRGCPNPADQTVKMENNGMGTSNYFSFNMFEFSGKSTDIYMHCKLELCLKQGPASCAPACGGARRRRSAKPVYTDTTPALISMAWTN